MVPEDRSTSGPVRQAVERRDDLPDALARVGLHGPRPVLVSVGGASGMAQEHLDLMRDVLRDHVLPVLAARRAVVADGGTDSGVMRVMGQVRHETGLDVPLVGVAATGTVSARANGRDGDTADLEPHHSAVILVPGSNWGDESPWLGRVADALGGPSATLLVNGGRIAYEDLRHSVRSGRPVVVADGTGRAAEQIARASRGDTAEAEAVDLARSARLRVVDVTDGHRLAAVLGNLLGPP